MCGILINNQEFNIEKTKYILSNLIANWKQMDEEVFCSTVGQTILWANKGNEIKHKIFFFSFSFLNFSCFHWSHNCEKLSHPHLTKEFLIYFTWLLKTIKALESNCRDTYKILLYCTLQLYHRWWHTSKALSFHWRFSSSSLTSWEALLGLWRPSLRDAILAVSPSTLPLAPTRKNEVFFKFSAVQAPQLHCHKSANKIIVTLLFYIYLGLPI